MGTFKNYLFENDTSVEEFIKFSTEYSIKNKKCSLLYRGSKFSDNYGKRVVRQDRQPTDTPEKLHNMINKAFEKKFGIKDLRSRCVFSSTSRGHTMDYGTPAVIFPNNPLFIYSTSVVDLYGSLGGSLGYLLDKWNIKIEDHNLYKYIVKMETSLIRLMKRNDVEETEKSIFPYIEKLIEVIIDTYQKTTKYDLPVHGREVMIVCDKYYYITYDTISNLDNSSEINTYEDYLNNISSIKEEITEK